MPPVKIIIILVCIVGLVAFALYLFIPWFLNEFQEIRKDNKAREDPHEYKKQKMGWSPVRKQYFDYDFKEDANDARQAQWRLQKLADSFMYLFDDMPPVKVYIDYQPIPESGSLARGGNGRVTFKYEAYKGSSEVHLVAVLKHEMVHCWIDWKGIKVSDPHGIEFQNKLEQVLNGKAEVMGDPLGLGSD